jgi:hypothetical protein
MIREANLHWRYVDGEIIMPWYTLPTLQWLKSINVSSWLVFEYGAGYSTIWWRLNCAGVVSVDTVELWAKSMGANYFKDKTEYIQACKNYRGYDCIIVDGQWREECIEFCLPFIKQGGYLIIDNYGSEDHDISKTEHLLLNWQFELHKQPNHSSWKTAVFKKI